MNLWISINLGLRATLSAAIVALVACGGTAEHQEQASAAITIAPSASAPYDEDISVVAHCDYHGTRTGTVLPGPTGRPSTARPSASDQLYAQFESSLMGPNGQATASIQAEVMRHEVGGLSIAIIEGNRISQHHWYGCRDRKALERTEFGTMYQAASLSKMVASMAFVRAQRLGDLGLHETIHDLADEHSSTLLAEWVDEKFAPRLVEPQISIARLLSHSAGLDTHSIGAWEVGHVPTMREILMGSDDWGGQYAGGVEPTWDPGTVVEYSGGGFTVAELALELASGDEFRDYARDEILTPAGLHGATFDKAQPDDARIARGCSRGSCDYGVRQTNVKAAGGLLTTVRDYAELVVALSTGGLTASGARVLQPADVAQMLTPVTDGQDTLKPCTSPGATADAVSGSTIRTEVCIGGQLRRPLGYGADYYGLGVILSPVIAADGYPRRVSHGGAQVGARAYFEIDRQTGNGFVVMINGVEVWTRSSGPLAGVDMGGQALLGAIRDAYRHTY